MSDLLIKLLIVTIIAAVITLAFVFVLFRRVKRVVIANEKISNVTDIIADGAMAFMKREYKVIIPFILAIALVLALLGLIPGLEGAEGVGWQSALCLVVGSLFSGLAGFVGMKIATKANGRTTQAAKNEGMNGALKIAFSGGAVLGLSVVGFGLLGLAILFLVFFLGYGGTANAGDAAAKAIHVVSGYGLGCSFIALFARVGGGIYTKAADVGADLVGKIETDLPEDDPRNPATIADNVGDNVGDIAGMGSDLCESYVGSIVSALSLSLVVGVPFELSDAKQIGFVFLICAIGVIASVISTIIIRCTKSSNAQKTLSIATYIATGVEVLGSFALSQFVLNNIFPFLCVVVGLVAGVLVGEIAEIYTSSDFKTVKEIAKESTTGHATNIIAGFGSGMKSTALTIAVLGIGIVFAYFLGKAYGNDLTPVDGVDLASSYGMWGIGLAAVGMLSTAGITVSVDGYGPISDNAGGIAEMCSLEPEVREITDTLDSVGNTTAAIGKGFCIGSATFTALALIAAYVKAANLKAADFALNNPDVIVGLLVGAMLPYLFSALTIKSVGKAANQLVDEIRSQFKANPGILAGTDKADYNKCIDIVTKAGLKEMILPGVIAVVSPFAAAFILGAPGLGGLLMGGLASAIMLAVFMANAGGAWDNAKKYIEEGNCGGKGSDAHKAAITGDTVGDPFKDTAGPAMDILIKLMSVIALILAPVMASGKLPCLWDLIEKLIH